MKSKINKIKGHIREVLLDFNRCERVAVMTETIHEGKPVVVYGFAQEYKLIGPGIRDIEIKKVQKKNSEPAQRTGCMNRSVRETR